MIVESTGKIMKKVTNDYEFQRGKNMKKFNPANLEYTWTDERENIVLIDAKRGYGYRLELRKDGRFNLVLNNNLVLLDLRKLNEIITIKPSLFSLGRISFIDKDSLLMEAKIDGNYELFELNISNKDRKDFNIVVSLLKEGFKNKIVVD